MSALLAWLVRVGLRGAVDRALAHLERRAELEGVSEQLKSRTTIEIARASVAEAQIMAEFNRAKLTVPWFWIFAALFIGPLGLWWAAGILDSVFRFSWSVADLPTPQMQQWAGDMIAWLFYVGTGVGAVKSLKR